jgi:fatty-acyl-CoA synthase
MHLSELAQRHPAKPAYIMGKSGEQISYEELDRRSNQGAHLLRKLGLNPGDHVAMQVENSIAFFVLLWSMRRAGLLYTAISTHLKKDEVTYIVRNCEAKAVIFSKSLAAIASQVRTDATDVSHWYMVLGDETGFANWDDACREFPTSAIADEQQGAPMLYSSGTTGLPKGVLPQWQPQQPFGELTPALNVIARLYTINENTVYLSTAPTYHAAPLAYNTLTVMLGGTSVIMEKFDAELSIALIEKYRVTHSQWVPIMFVRLQQLPAETKAHYDLSSLTHAIHAAAPCPVDLKHQMIAWFGPVIFEYYSSTEGGGLVGLSSAEWLAHPGSVGKAIIGKLHIVDDDGGELPQGEVGTIYFSEIKSNFQYYKDPAKTEKAFNKNGWMTVGDVGYLDADGYLYMSDRKDFMIISGGVNIYPQEVENLLLGHTKVADVAVFGVPDAEFGQVVKAVVQPRNLQDAGPELERELIAFCRERLSTVKCPKSVDFDAQLPRLDNGKLYKKALRERYLAKA